MQSKIIISESQKITFQRDKSIFKIFFESLYFKDLKYMVELTPTDIERLASMDLNINCSVHNLKNCSVVKYSSFTDFVFVFPRVMTHIDFTVERKELLNFFTHDNK